MYGLLWRKRLRSAGILPQKGKASDEEIIVLLQSGKRTEALIALREREPKLSLKHAKEKLSLMM